MGISTQRCRCSRISLIFLAACSVILRRTANDVLPSSWKSALAPFADRPAGKLSGGMKQKLGWCCALIHDPDFLILDEPTTGVDPLYGANSGV